MSFVDHLAERKIAEAIARGEFSGLPGEGAPLPADDAALVPEELRMAYRVLRNAGFVPPEVTALREIGDLERQLHQLPECEARSRALRKMQLLRARLEASGRFRHVFSSTSPYYGKLINRLQEGSNAHSEHAPGFGAEQGGVTDTADNDG